MTAQSHWDAFSASSVAVNECIYHLMLYEDTMYMYVYFFVHFSLHKVLVPLYIYLCSAELQTQVVSFEADIKGWLLCPGVQKGVKVLV